MKNLANEVAQAVAECKDKYKPLYDIDMKMEEKIFKDNFRAIDIVVRIAVPKNRGDKLPRKVKQMLFEPDSLFTCI